MDNNELGLVIIICAILFLPILAVVVKYCMDYSKNVRYVKMEIDRSDEWDEYVYWKMELRNLRWSILPGLTPDRVKRIRCFFYKGKHHKKEENDGLFSMILPSVVGIIVCSVCLAAGTYAWFTASVSAPTQKIQAANYTMTASTTYTNEYGQRRLELTANSEGGLSGWLEPAEHTVTLTAGGNAASGYCNIKIGDKEYYVKELKPSQSITFTVDISSEDIWIDVIPHWGTYQMPTDNPPEEITNGCLIEVKDTTNDPVKDETSDETTKPEIKTHKVESGETLSVIARKYGFTVEELAEYNDIIDINRINVGQELTIPPEGYKPPEKPNTPEPTEPADNEPTSTPQPEDTPDPPGTQETPVDSPPAIDEPSTSEAPANPDPNDIPA